MEITNPIHFDGWTIYTYFENKKFMKIKNLLLKEGSNINVVDCFDISNNFFIKKEFENFLINLTGNKKNKLPIVFYNGTYIGSYDEILLFIILKLQL